MRLRLYWKERKYLLCLFALFNLIFFVSFALYHLPLAAVVYPMIVSLACFVGYFLLDYIRLSKKHTHLQRLSACPAEGFPELPVAETVTDEDYQAIIRALCAEQAKKSADADERYRDMMEYYTTWAHQIKTPIAAMRLHLQNEDSALSRKLTAELFRIEQYVEMVLTFLRLDSDTSDYVFREYAADELIKQAIRKFSGEFIGRRLKLTFVPTDARIVTDEKWFSFVIEQILSNALKYTQTGGITIWLEKDGQLCIRDTGIGIAPEDLPRVFEKGYTGFNGRTDKKASGIGLYLCRRVCEKLGIAISAVSKVGDGTTVMLDLTQKRADAE